MAIALCNVFLGTPALALGTKLGQFAGFGDIEHLRNVDGWRSRRADGAGRGPHPAPKEPKAETVQHERNTDRLDEAPPGLNPKDQDTAGYSGHDGESQ